jgi:hypothetical protein
MDNEQDAQSRTHANEEEPLIVGSPVIGIGNDERGVIEKRGLRFLEADAMLAHVGAGLRRIPIEA